MPKTVLVTGGCGFIGANFLNWAAPSFPNVEFINLDALTYAANPRSIQPDIPLLYTDLCNADDVRQAVRENRPDQVIHFAAESHVDRSISGPRAFIDSNIGGTFNLLEACRELWDGDPDCRFHHVSTDEVYGSLGETGAFTEETPYDPSSPYSASKAASDHLVRAYHRTYGMAVTISNCSNNYGPYQFPEKLIPLMILNAREDKPLPVYGDGSNVRDWLYVRDHCEAIWTIATKGRSGETYNVGGDSERTNLEVVQAICDAVGDGKRDLITFVKDRPGHDWRYAIDFSKLESELGWKPSCTFEEGLQETVDWYLTNKAWVESVRGGEYREWIKEHYGA